MNSIDALLVLQYEAGLITDLSCREAADANYDSALDVIDVALILQVEEASGSALVASR